MSRSLKAVSLSRFREDLKWQPKLKIIRKFKMSLRLKLHVFKKFRSLTHKYRYLWMGLKS